MSLSVNENALTRVATVTGINLAGTADTETVLYLVPTGHTFVPVMVVLRNFSAIDHATTPATVTLGIGGGACDEFIGTSTPSTLSGMGANFANEAIILQPVPATTPAVVDIIPAGSTFSLEITQANGAAQTCTADVFGYLF
jgi:hypothetical protein